MDNQPQTNNSATIGIAVAVFFFIIVIGVIIIVFLSQEDKSPACTPANADSCKKFCTECKEEVVINQASCNSFITKETCATKFPVTAPPPCPVPTKETCKSFINSQNCGELNIAPSVQWADKILKRECGSYTDAGTTLSANDALPPCSMLRNNGWTLKNQLDGNLVIYNPLNEPKWNIMAAPWNISAIRDSQYNRLVFNSDGNLSVKGRNDVALWWAVDPNDSTKNLSGKATNGQVMLTKDGVLVVRDASGTVVWAANGPLTTEVPSMASSNVSSKSIWQRLFG